MGVRLSLLIIFTFKKSQFCSDPNIIMWLMDSSEKFSVFNQVVNEKCRTGVFYKIRLTLA